MKYCENIRLDLAYKQAVEWVREALAEQGFGVLTELDVRACGAQERQAAGLYSLMSPPTTPCRWTK